MTIKAIFILTLLLIGCITPTYSQNFPDRQDSYEMKRWVDEIYGKHYEIILVTIESNNDFYHASGYWRMSISENSTTISPYKLVNMTKEERMAFSGDSTSILLGYFTADAIDNFKNEKIKLSYGYHVPVLGRKIDNEIKPLDPLLKSLNAPKLTKTLLEQLVRENERSIRKDKE